MSEAPRGADRAGTHQLTLDHQRLGRAVAKRQPDSRRDQADEDHDRGQPGGGGDDPDAGAVGGERAEDQLGHDQQAHHHRGD